MLHLRLTVRGSGTTLCQKVAKASRRPAALSYSSCAAFESALVAYKPAHPSLPWVTDCGQTDMGT
eukprot:6215626-Amphidinium_carterae.2